MPQRQTFPRSRRNLLRAAGITVALPALPSLRRPAKAAEPNQPEQLDDGPRRMVCIGNMLGFYPGAFWPDALAGNKHPSGERRPGGNEPIEKKTLSPTLASLESRLAELTIIGGLDHGLKGGHFAIHGFLSGLKHSDAKTMPDGNISVDQYAAEKSGGQTRFASLTVGSDSGIHGGCQMSWSRAGTRVPPITGPKELFDKLFVGTKASDKQLAEDRIRLKQSILDSVNGDAKSIAKSLNPRDRQKLDEYLSSIRDVEKRLDNQRNWIDVPKPPAPFDPPRNSNMVDDLPMLYDLITIALQTDSTRIATLEIGGDFEARDFGFKSGYHALSHHGMREDAIAALKVIDAYQVEQFSRFLQKLSDLESGETSLLSRTSVLFGSGMGNANSHTNSNLPIILAGGGFKHRGFLAFDQASNDRPPLTNLFLSMLQRFGIETDRFATSTGTLTGLEFV
ncbi:DUF1552 domain-containing protein [Rhodopirellula sp. MGV]|uniref:DUF1552 domain-containing protein n=1 Tax=Rhodopirellula sp. MGV TaxID=2023130 RepID=UPI000B966CE2|nr:DUF1552 domain-containing protein [Rhodopirellula sp. MGV]OYP32275.1 hypothetical protein CGZ80_19605 [Rhodopirellula sp. MGV]PNY35941.1 DUF1552 domain-containing protein [Rhodopirellula baltica]